MVKSIIKEIIIMLLLCVAILLILGVLLYEYVPSNKIIPEEVAYTTPDAVKEELSKNDGVDDEQVILTYSIDATDLNNYERINTYVPGKPNPFSSFDGSTTSGESSNQASSTSSGTNNNNTSTTNNSTSSNTTNSSSDSENSTNSTSEYYPDDGTK